VAEQGYKERSARERLAMYKQQMLGGSIQDSVLSRMAKNSRRRDFKQQVQPIYEQVQFDAGQRIKWGRPRVIKNAILNTKGVMSGGYLNGPSPESGHVETGGKGIIQSKQRWTTEGYQDMGTRSETDTQNVGSDFVGPRPGGVRKLSRNRLADKGKMRTAPSLNPRFPGAVNG